MQVDPTDDCTFWYIDEYQQVTGYENWTTRIASFIFPTCGSSGGGPVMSLAPSSLKWGKIAVGNDGRRREESDGHQYRQLLLSITNIATTGDFATSSRQTDQKDNALCQRHQSRSRRNLRNQSQLHAHRQPEPAPAA